MKKFVHPTKLAQPYSKGFTLIELLVVVAIIGLLASIVMTSLGSARIKARDARRIGDFHSLYTALQLYSNDHAGAYPNCTASSPDGSGWIYSTNSASWNCLTLALAPYLKVPIDPINNIAAPWTTGNYSYAYIMSGQDYDLVGQLEDPTSQLRCQVKNWSFHYLTGGWCTLYGYSNYLFEDHI